MKKQKLQKLIKKYGVNHALQKCRPPFLLMKSSFLLSTFTLFFFLMGNGIMQAQCSITNLSASNIDCGTGFNEDDSFFTATFDVVNGSGDYSLINPTNNILYGRGLGLATNGTVSFTGQASIPGVTPGGSTQVIVLDEANASCMAGPISFNVPICPPPNQAPTSNCADPIEVSSTNCGTDTSPNTPSGFWGALPASGIQSLGFGFPGSTSIPIDFNCLADDNDMVGELELRLASSAFVSGSDPCNIYLENVYDVRDSEGAEALELITILVEFTGCSSDTEAPTLTCAEFTASGSSCPNFHDPNTPNGSWTSVPASGTFLSTVGGGIATGTVDLNGCLTDNVNSLTEMEYTLLASYQENLVPGCSKDIINEYQVRDACGNVSPNTFIFRGTITYSGPPPMITCPGAATVNCGDSTDPSVTGMATATSGCGTPTVTYVDNLHSEPCRGFVREWTATDGCGQTSFCTQPITVVDAQAPTSSCADPIEIYADFCPTGIGPGTPNGGWGNIPASGIINLQVGPIHMVDLNCLMDNVDVVGDLEIRLASANFVGTPTSCLRVIESTYDIRDAAGNIAPNLITVRFTLENDDPITQTPSAGITCGETFTMQSQLDYIYTVEPPSNGVSGNQDCRSALIWRTPTFETPCGDFTEFSISFSAESSPAPNDLPANMIFGGTSGNPIPAFPYIPPSQYFHGSSESCAATTRVTYNLVDECGKTFTCFFLIEVEDNQPPIPTCNDIEVRLVEGTYTLTQADEDAIGAGSSDNCGLNASLTGILPTTFTTADIGDNLVTYNVTDNCGNTAACVATVTVTCPLVLDCSLITDQSLECRSDLPPVNFDLVTAIDSCGDLIKSALTIIPGNDGCPGNPVIITREYFVNDGINSKSCMQTFTIESTIPPSISCPANLTLQCDEDTSPANTGMATGTASCSNFSLDITFTDASTQGTTGCSQYQYEIERTWSAVDGCGRITTCLQTITVEDNTPPVINCPADITVECDQSTDPSATGTATATGDNCAADNELTITFSDVSTQGATGCEQYQYMITRTWTASDPCGNTAVCTQTIMVEDSTPPTITCPANMTLECDEDTSIANTGIPTVNDNCASALEVVTTLSEVSTQGTIGCAKYEYTITRTWTSTDVCGNNSTCSQVIRVDDTQGPAITCPANQTLACDTDPLPIANTINEFMAIGGTVGDNCSNLTELTISVNDNPTNQSMLNFCPGTSVADRTLTRTYTITDACGNSSTCTQSFIYLPSVLPPTITSTPPNQTVDCAVNAFPQLGLFSAEGDCSDISYSVSAANSLGAPGCPGNRIQYTYTATDVCGRSATHIQTYTLSNEGPEFICPVDICIIECPANTDMIQTQFDDYANLASVYSSCSETSISIGNNFNPNGFIPQNCANPTVAVPNAVAYQIVRFTATDACGRNATCTAMVVITDSDGPVVTGNVSFGLADCNDTDLQEGYTNWATGQLNSLSATDECSNGVVNFSYSPLTPNVDCSSGLATTEVSFIATDACGNATMLTANYRIIDNGTSEPAMATVSGNLLTEGDEMIALVNVEVEGFLNNQMITNNDGYYHFDLATAQNYAIEPSRNDDPLNGITTYDLILLGQHLLGINSLDSPYKMIAADVNESGHISSLDMIALRRLILQIDDEFSTGKSWTFVDAAYVFPEPMNPFASTFPTAHNINNLASNEIVDFIGVKLGDLNASANPMELQVGDTRSSEGSLKLKVESQLLEAGQRYELTFKASDFKEVEGFQFTLDFATDYLLFLDYQGSELSSMSADNFGFTKVKEGKITASWNENQPLSLADDEVVFKLEFAALKAVELAEVLKINSTVTASEAYQDDLLKEVELSIEQPALDKLILFQNQPNPFDRGTMISFQLTEPTDADLSIFDATGRKVWTHSKSYDAGIHQVFIEKDELGDAGIYYYQLFTGQRRLSKKMIMVK